MCLGGFGVIEAPECRMSSLTRLLDPGSIAVVGASASPGKAGYQALRTLAGFHGTLLPINPNAAEILGFKANPSLTSARNTTGIAPDLAILVIPAAACLDAVRDAAQAGCGGVLIVSGGFAETGGEGARLQADIAHLCRDAGIRLLGPNTSGFIRPRTACAASFAPGIEQFRDGGVAVVAQSGGVNLTLAFLVHRLGVGLSLAVGLGNAADVDVADVLEYLAADSRTKAIALHLEGVREGRRVYETLRRVTPLKPVVAVTPGRADIGVFARSHTGNLIGAYDRKIAALRQAGVVVVETTDEAADAVSALAHTRIAPASDPGLGVLTGQAGPGLLMVDRLRAGGVRVPEFNAATLKRIESLLPPMTFMRNPVDTGRPSPTFPAVLRAIAEDAGVDAIAVFALDEPAAVDPAAVLSAAKRDTSKPMLFGTVGLHESIAPTVEHLWTAGIPAYTSPERLASAARALVEDARLAARVARGRVEEAPPRFPAALELPLHEATAKALVSAYGIPTPRGVVCRTEADAVSAFAALRKPVVAKILTTEIVHKTEVGGVRLGIDTEADLRSALAALDAIPLTGERAYLVEEMAPRGMELIAGAVRDPSFGPVVMVGLGGTAAEALQDTAVRLGPLGEAEALEMLDELHARRLLEGWRGAPPVDRNAIARTLVALGRILLDHPSLGDIELNPLVADADGVIALDALAAAAQDVAP